MIHWQSITDFGQMKEGDLILIQQKNGVVFPETVKEIIRHGSENEEIVFSMKQNKYFITKMLLDGESWAQSVVKVIDGKATCIINNFIDHHYMGDYRK